MFIFGVRRQSDGAFDSSIRHGKQSGVALLLATALQSLR